MSDDRLRSDLREMLLHAERDGLPVLAASQLEPVMETIWPLVWAALGIAENEGYETGIAEECHRDSCRAALAEAREQLNEARQEGRNEIFNCIKPRYHVHLPATCWCGRTHEEREL